MKLLKFFHKTTTFLFYFAILASIASGFSNAALAGLISHQIAMQEPLNNWFLNSLVFLILIAVGFDFLAKQMLNLLVNRVVYELRLSFAGQILTTPFSRLEMLGIPRLFALLTEDTQLIGNVVAELPTICIGLATLIGCVAYLAWLSPLTLFGLVLLALPIFFGYWLLQKKTRQLLQNVLLFRNQIFSTYRDLTEGMKELKLHIHRLSVFYYDHLQPLVGLSRETNTTYHRYHLLAQSVNQFTYFVIILGLFVVSRWLGTSIEVLGAYAIMILYLKTATMTLVSAVPRWSEAQMAIDQIEKLGFSLIMPTPIAKNANTKNANALRLITDSVQIDVQALTYKYHQMTEENSFHIGPLTCTFKSGEIVFITGGNGSGKTTFLKLLIGLYIPKTGQITWNGRSVTAENLEQYRQNFAVIFAEPYLFPHLMGLAGEKIDQHARAWLQRLQLTHKVKVVDGKLSTLNLSFGQRKRLALLTAYLEERPVYIFDEWAAGQDPEFREFFYRTLLPELKAQGKLVIAITHDDQYFDAADRVLKMTPSGLNTM
ncbi:MAG: cyclic peptide export ABC transporter [Ardenticatenaceae bacterium]